MNCEVCGKDLGTLDEQKTGLCTGCINDQADKELEKAEKIKADVEKCLSLYGVAFTYDNVDEIVVLDPNKVTIHKCMASITKGDGNPILFKGQKMLFNGPEEAEGALKILQLLGYRLGTYKVERYNNNKKIIRI